MSFGSKHSPALFEAVQRGDAGYVTRTADRTIDFDANQTDEYVRTPLHWAAELGHVKVAEALLDYGASIEALECNGRTPLHLAARAVNAEMLETLLESADETTRVRAINQTDKFGITAVSLVLQKLEEGKDALQVLVKYGARLTNTTPPPAPSADAAAQPIAA